jgi:hypothetical protein
MRKEERGPAAEDILSTYIVAGAPSELNIASVMRDAVIRRVTNNKTSSDAFMDAEREVMTLIRRNIFDSFTNTEGYQVCQILIKSSQVNTNILFDCSHMPPIDTFYSDHDFYLFVKMTKSSTDALRAIRKDTSHRTPAAGTNNDAPNTTIPKV